MDISVIIPSKNEEQYIEGCLKSIKQQGGSWEIIVVDNSSDSTRKIAKNYGKVIVEKRKGPAIARNVGAKAASGDILLFSDADVRFPRGCFTKIRKEFATGIGGAVFNLVPWDSKNRLQTKTFAFWNWIVKWMNKTGLTFTNGSCFAFDSKAFEAVGGFDPKLLTNEDHDMARRISEKSPFVFLDIKVMTSLRRLQDKGTFAFLKEHIKSTLLYFLFGESNPDYWDD